MTPDVAILFARRDSNYKLMPGCDVYDADRDARTFRGGLPVVAHPPCRSWGRLRAFANPVPGERENALWAVEQVQAEGGVLEHPDGSTLWGSANLPKPGCEPDQYGGWRFAAPQKWWGHRAEKNTWFYIVGVGARDIPAIPIILGEATHVVQSRKRHDYRPHITKAEREHTPPLLCEWLVTLARSASK